MCFVVYPHMNVHALLLPASPLGKILTPLLQKCDGMVTHFCEWHFSFMIRVMNEVTAYDFLLDFFLLAWNLAFTSEVKWGLFVYVIFGLLNLGLNFCLTGESWVEKNNSILSWLSLPASRGSLAVLAQNVMDCSFWDIVHILEEMFLSICYIPSGQFNILKFFFFKCFLHLLFSAQYSHSCLCYHSWSYF